MGWLIKASKNKGRCARIFLNYFQKVILNLWNVATGLKFRKLSPRDRRFLSFVFIKKGRKKLFIVGAYDHPNSTDLIFWLIWIRSCLNVPRTVQYQYFCILNSYLSYMCVYIIQGNRHIQGCILVFIGGGWRGRGKKKLNPPPS